MVKRKKEKEEKEEREEINESGKDEENNHLSFLFNLILIHRYSNP
jgi:hypothetical protein